MKVTIPNTALAVNKYFTPYFSANLGYIPPQIEENVYAIIGIIAINAFIGDSLSPVYPNTVSR